MDPLLIAGILTVVLFVLLAAGLWVSLTLMLLGLLTMVMLDNNASGGAGNASLPSGSPG